MSCGIRTICFALLIAAGVVALAAAAVALHRRRARGRRNPVEERARGLASMDTYVPRPVVPRHPAPAPCRRCPRCGEPVEEDDLFCIRCGERL